jgi:hypothetical protein
MTTLQKLIEGLSERAADSDLLALLATSREGRLHNATLAQELRGVVEALRHELDQRQPSILRQSDEIRIGFRKH